MKRIYTRLLGITLLACALLLGLPALARADGIIIPIPRPPLPPQRIGSLAVRYHRVQVNIVDQVATTEVDQVFVNELNQELEGLYMFPLPEGAAISEFALYVDGEKVEGRLLDKEEARRVYEDIVRREQDPALLEYVGRNAFQARIFPIAPKGERRITLRYSQILRAEGGLIRYLYPLSTERFSVKPLREVSIHVNVASRAPIRTLYSPSHQVAISRDDELHAEISYEEEQVRPDRDFELFYSMTPEAWDVQLLSYRDKGEDGFFLAFVAPQLQAQEEEIIAKDVVVVLDISGSMRGEKLRQAQEALAFILDHLHEEDRFNLIAFSSSTRRYAAELQPAHKGDDAVRFVRSLEAAGGTNLNRALTEAMGLLQPGDRPQVVIFLTDGLATEGVVQTDAILENVSRAARSSARLFTFGIGDEVNTILLDTLAERHRGASAYVRPNQSIEEEVSAFYDKIGSPLLADLTLAFDGVLVEETYPYPLPDLFAGSQLVVAGRYRTGGATTLTLTGSVNGRTERFTYPNLQLSERGGDAFIPRLWATRKIGYLLTQIRLHGENKELIDEIVALSVRYGIMTPYTSFLVDEQEDVLTQRGRDEAAQKMYNQAQATKPAAAGAPAVERSLGQRALTESEVAPSSASAQVKQVGNVSFILRDGVWMDTRYDPARMTAHKVRFGSDAYFALLQAHPEWGAYLAVGAELIVRLDDQFIAITQQGGEENAPPTPTATTAAATTVASPTRTPTAPATALSPAPGFWQRLRQWAQQLFF